MFSSETNAWIKYKFRAMKANSYSPDQHTNIKFLTLMACHSDRVLKKFTIINNINKVNFKNNDIVIINSENTLFGASVKEESKNIVKEYIEVENDINTLDIGKFMIGLEKYNYLNYDFVVFMNDSIIVTKPINHFYNIMLKRNHDLFGINSSSEIKYHYQSYLYGIKSSAIINLINLYQLKKTLLNSGYKGVVNNIELELCNNFENKGCFLDFALIPEIKNGEEGGIFKLGEIYDTLVKTGLFPLTKVRWMKKI
jgi:hypothetical protein